MQWEWVSGQRKMRKFGRGREGTLSSAKDGDIVQASKVFLKGISA